MEALLDGKTLGDKYVDGEFYKLDDEGNLLLMSRTGWQVLENWLLTDTVVYEEYPLTFEQALTAMLDGKVVMCKEPFHGYAYRFHNGIFESAHVSDCFTRWEQDGMPSFRQNSKWKVVE